ncbi:MAG: helix-turn-helix transcriptional regulator [Angelakisella sp.]|jgi:DNA-binding HxlR family transcriptional regulator|nr:helix-turn-helix transcriptional regulator [Angelakisella sp.]
MNEPMSFQEFREQVPIRTQGGSCAVTPVVHMFQGKWKLEILYGLCVKSPLRFGELRKMLGGVTNSALTGALRELEADGLILRVQFNEIPPHVEYSLTTKGEDLLPIFYSIAMWGLKYIP